MDEPALLYWIAWSMIINAVMVVCILNFIVAPYGRYSNTKWGFLMNGNLAWFLQELPSLSIPMICLFVADSSALSNRVNQTLCALFILHYTQRTLIFPALIKGKPTPFIVFLFALIFCFCNGYLQGRNHTQFLQYPSWWIYDVRFISGVVLFFFGMFINIHSDHILRNLRKPGETGYKIPKGGAFEYVSGANFLGEIIEWSGYAMASWSLPAFAFAFYTACNIGPRAYHHHRYYLNKFEDYPKNRKALIPFIF